MTPIILHHGFLGHAAWQIGPVKWSYFKGIDNAILARKYPLIITGVHPTASVATRARQLKETILSRLSAMNRSGEKVVILAHSMGGLDARYMLSHLGMAQHTKAVVTISTPHRGSAYADWCVQNLGHKLGGLQLMKYLGLDVQGLLDVTLAGCEQFNQSTPDEPGVKYYSVSAQRPENQMPPFARHPHRVIRLAQGENDGLVAVSSARWGEHLATWPVDHWLLINRRLVPNAGRSGRIIGYWMNILNRLEADGVLEGAGARRASVASEATAQ